MWIVRQKIENKRNLFFKKQLFFYLNYMILSENSVPFFSISPSHYLFLFLYDYLICS